MTFKQDLARIQNKFKGYSQGNTQDKEDWAAWKRIKEKIQTLEARAGYLTECPSCGEGPSKTGFPRMDEDGCCACCGADCSILGTVEALREREGWDTALAFYANSTNYDEFGVPRIPHEGHPGCKVPDMGRTAKIALLRA